MDFWKDRDFLKNQYEEAKWDDSTGILPKETDRILREYIKSHSTVHKAMVRSELLNIVVEKGRLAWNPYDLFPDKIDQGAKYETCATFGVFGQICAEDYYIEFDKIAVEERKERYRLGITGTAIPDVDFWHTPFDFERILHRGVGGLMEDLQTAETAKQKDGSYTEDNRIFYASARRSLQAVQTYIRRFVDYAEQKQGSPQYYEDMRCLLNDPPKNLWQALQLIRIFLTVGELGFERIREMGVIDRLLYPYYQAEKSAGKTNEEIKTYFLYFFERISAEKRYADQPICLAGLDQDGRFCDNELTYIILDAYDELGNHNPKIHIKSSPTMPEKLLTKVADMIRRGRSSIILVNDEVVIKAYEKIGISRDVSWKYLPVGCNEPVVVGVEDARICSTWLNLAKAVELTVLGGVGSLQPQDTLTFSSNLNPLTFEQFYFVYLQHLRCLIDMTANSVIKQTEYQYLVNPFPLYSSTLQGCVESGKDVFNNGAKIRNSTIKCFALATAVDSLLAVKHFVYDSKEITLEQLRQALIKDWEGYEELRIKILKYPNKWGNNLAEPNALAKDITDFCAKLIVGRPNGNGGVFRMGGDSVNFAEEYGGRMGATPDGRKARQPLSKNIRPVNGMEKNGLLAYLNSVTHIDNSNFVGGLPTDFMLHPTAVEGEQGLKAFVSVLRTFFKKGGMSIHGNIVSAEILEEAKAHPEKYPQLQIRVWGWNEYFVNMQPHLQDDFIKRAKGEYY